eukprot:gene8314-1589_t
MSAYVLYGDVDEPYYDNTTCQTHTDLRQPPPTTFVRPGPSMQPLVRRIPNSALLRVLGTHQNPFTPAPIRQTSRRVRAVANNYPPSGMANATGLRALRLPLRQGGVSSPCTSNGSEGFSTSAGKPEPELAVLALG